MAKTFTDLSQLKKFRPAEPEPPPPEPELTPEDRQLVGAASSADYFSSLLGTPSAQRQKEAPRRTTVVTPGTVARVRIRARRQVQPRAVSQSRKIISVWLPPRSFSFSANSGTGTTIPGIQSARGNISSAADKKQ